VILVSDHGFARFTRRVDVNAWLAGLGMVRFNPDGTVMPESSRAWSQMWGIYLNERLLDGAGREAAIARLLEAAPNAVDPDNGQRLGLTLARREDVYQGLFLNDAPHLVVTASNRAYVPEFWDHKNVGSVRALCRDTTRHTAWDHAPDGILVAAGPGVRHQTDRVRLTVYDIVPTVLAWAGLPVARDMDGRVADELFQPGALPPVTWCDTYDAAAPGRPGEVEAGSLEDRLRALGYVREH
jgi:predicted AlkP superfamily phosphohydrolase/phosphomutase